MAIVCTEPPQHAPLKLSTAPYATAFLCVIAAASPGTDPCLRAVEPKPSRLAVGALTLEPTPALMSVDWLDRASTVQERPRQRDQRLADEFLEERKARLSAETNPLFTAPATPETVGESPSSAASHPSAAEEDAPAFAPDARPTEFFTGYGANSSTAPASSLSHASVDASLTGSGGNRVSAYTPEASFPAPAPASAAAVVSSGYATTRGLPAPNFSVPTASWAGGGFARGFSGEDTTLPAAPVPTSPAVVPPTRTGLGSGGFTDLSATSPVQAHPAPLLVAPQPNALPAGQALYISELNGIISSATGNGGSVSTYKTISTTNALFGIGAFGGSLYVVEQNANAIDRVVLSTGAVSTFASLGATNNRPTALAIDASGNIYVTLSNTGGINKITPAGVVSLFATLPTGAQPQGLAIAPNGNLYSANSGLDSISQITPAGVVSTFATFSGGSYPTALYFGGLTVDTNGNLYVVDQETTAGALGNVYKVTTGGAISLFASVGANQQPIGLAFDSNSVLYTANFGSISQITPAGVVSTFANDGNGPDYLVVVGVPEPTTYLGGALLFGVAWLGLRRRLYPT